MNILAIATAAAALAVIGVLVWRANHTSHDDDNDEPGGGMSTW